MPDGLESAQQALEAAADDVWDRYYSLVYDEGRHEFQVYGFEQRSVRRWQVTGGLSLWVSTYPVEQQEHWFPVYSRRLRSDALVPLMPLAEAKRRVVELVVVLLDDA